MSVCYWKWRPSYAGDDFHLQIREDGTPVFTVSLNGDCVGPIAAGQHLTCTVINTEATITEGSFLDNLGPTFSGDCTKVGTFAATGTISIGQQLTCTITNHVT
jgi:hypothetical protein